MISYDIKNILDHERQWGKTKANKRTLLFQTSPPVHDPQHIVTAVDTQPRDAAAEPDALLHPPHPDQEPLRHGRRRQRCIPRLSSGKSMYIYLSILSISLSINVPRKETGFPLAIPPNNSVM